MRIQPLLLLTLVLLFLFSAPVLLFAGEVKPGAILSITSALLGDEVYVPNVTYNSKHKEYLVVYHWRNPFLGNIRQVHAARIGEEGDYIANFVVSDSVNHCGSPDVAYDPVSDRYLVVWMWDKNGDGSNWDLRGRFVPYNGPDSGMGSFVIPSELLYHEYTPQVAYGAAQKDFLVLSNLLRNDGASIPPYIAGLRIKADGSGMPAGGIHDFNIISGSENRINPKVVYNSVQDQYLVVFENGSDIFAQRLSGLNGGLLGSQIGVAGWPSTEDQPAVAFSSTTDTYVITWDADRATGNGEVYGRFVNGDGTVGTVFRLDDDLGGVRPDFTTAVACKESTDECLAYWITINNNTYYTFGRQFHAGGDVENGSPWVNLNTVALWGGVGPQLAVGGGKGNYYMAFKGFSGVTQTLFGQPTQLFAFPWNLFLPAILNGKIKP